MVPSLLDITKANHRARFSLQHETREKLERQENENGALLSDRFITNVSAWDLQHSVALLHDVYVPRISPV